LAATATAIRGSIRKPHTAWKMLARKGMFARWIARNAAALAANVAANHKAAANRGASQMPSAVLASARSSSYEARFGSGAFAFAAEDAERSTSIIVR